MPNIPALQNLSVVFSISIILSFVLLGGIRFAIIPMVPKERVKWWEETFKFLLFNLMCISGAQSVIGLYLFYKGF